MTEDLNKNETEITETETPGGESPNAAEVSAAGDETPAAVSEDSAPSPREDQHRSEDGRSRGERPYRKTEGGKMPRFRRKVCRFCYEKELKIDYRDQALLEKFITDRGKILPRRSTGTCARHQREVANAIKRARIIAIIPFVEK